jgi:hypothetical protein
MTLPRVRFTVRRLMVAVAVAAVVLGGLAYAARLAQLRRLYYRRATELRYAEQTYRHPSYRDEVQDVAAANRLGQMAEKYEKAADRPWLPVAPDPAEPE